MTAITIVITWPLILHLDTLVVDRVDGLLITWYLNWVIHALTSGGEGLRNFYNANIFFPAGGTLAFSDFMLPEAILAMPAVLIFHEPLLAYNLNLLGGFILTGWAVFLLVRYLSGKADLAFFIALLFTFSPFRFVYLVHLQLLNFWPVILAIYFLLRKRYFLYALFFGISSLTTALFLYFLLLTAGLWFLWQKKERVAIIKSTLIAGLFTAPFLLPYFFVSRQYHYVRPIRDAIHFSLAPQDLAGQFFPGWVFITLFLGTLAMLISTFRKSKKIDILPREISYWFILALLAFVLALGPALHIFKNTVHIGPLPALPLPYALFYYLVPGFSGFRTPSRWLILSFLAVCVATGMILRKHLRPKILLLFSLLVLFQIKYPLSFYPVPKPASFPPEQVWLSTLKTTLPLIQFPIYRWDDSQLERETLREYYSTIHWQPMFNGYSGFSPKEWEVKVRWLQANFPSAATIQYLQDQKIKLVLAPVSWEAKISRYPALKLIKSFPQTDIYAIGE